VLNAEGFLPYARWLRLLLTSAFGELMVEEKAAAPIPVLFLLNEFAALGALPVVETAVAVARGYGIQLWSVLQSLAQLKAVYGLYWQTFLANADIKQFLRAGDVDTAEEVSMMCGQTTVAVHTVGPSSGEGVSVQQRPLFLPDQIMGMPDDVLLMFAPGLPQVIRGFCVPYNECPEFDGLMMPVWAG
jgi:type IV secretion system protein VirD4